MTDSWEPRERDEELVTIAKFLQPVNAQLAKGVLESAGSRVFCRARMRTA